eukprot:790420-Rhodomonas_salina.1
MTRSIRGLVGVARTGQRSASGGRGEREEAEEEEAEAQQWLTQVLAGLRECRARLKGAAPFPSELTR